MFDEVLNEVSGQIFRFCDWSIGCHDDPFNDLKQVSEPAIEL